MNASEYKLTDEELRLAAVIAADIRKDNCQHAFIEHPAERESLVAAYVGAHFKKQRSLQSLYLTNSDFRKEMQELVRSILS
jgi:hypothetical protein